LLVVTALMPLAALADDEEEVHTLRFSAEGNYAVVAAGKGMRNEETGTITLDVPGTAIRAAYLYWSGLGSQSGGDNSVSLSVDGAPGVPITAEADGSYGPLLWWGELYYFAYTADVTKLVEFGEHTYTISDFGNGINRRDGTGLVVVYEDPALPFSRAEIWDGLDRFFRDWGEGARGESAVNCFAFLEVPEERQFDYVLVLGEMSAGDQPRPNALWHMMGTKDDTMPADMLNTPTDGPVTGDLIQGPPNYPFTSADGAQWDTYSQAVTVPADKNWICFQVESAQEEDYNPASGVWIVTAGAFRVQEPLGTIVIEKATNPAGGDGFGFDGDLGPFTLDDGGSQEFADIAQGTYAVVEDDPGPAYRLADLVCSDPDGETTVDLEARTASIDLDPDETVTCRFANDMLPEIEITVTKTAIPRSVEEPGEKVEFLIEVSNASQAEVRIRSLQDTAFDLNTHCADAVGKVLGAGETYSCEFREEIEGKAGEVHTNEVTATVVDRDGYEGTASAEATVNITEGRPSICLPAGLLGLALLLILAAIGGWLWLRGRGSQPAPSAES
jgi:hypothetical protein